MTQKTDPRGIPEAVAERGGRPEGPEETLGQVVRAGAASEGLVRRYADLGLIPCRRDAYGRRVFPAGTGELVRQLKAKRLAQMGQPRIGE